MVQCRLNLEYGHIDIKCVRFDYELARPGLCGVYTVYIGRTDVEYTGKRDQTALFIIFIDILKERFILSRATTHSIDAIKIIIVW